MRFTVTECTEWRSGATAADVGGLVAGLRTAHGSVPLAPDPGTPPL